MLELKGSNLEARNGIQHVHYEARISCIALAHLPAKDDPNSFIH